MAAHPCHAPPYAGRMTDNSGPRGRLYYGWVVVAVTVVALLVAAGARSAPGVFLLPMQEALGLDRGTLSFSASLGLLVFGLAAPLSGRLMDRFGPRRVATAGLLLLAVSFGLSTLARSALALHLSWGLLSGLGTGLVGSVLGATVATRWFVRRRGLVVGVFGAATSAGQLLFIPLLTAWAGRIGWDGAALVVAGAALLLALPLWALLRDRPEALGLQPDGDTHARPTPPPVPDPHVMRRAVRSRDFWLLSLTTGLTQAPAFIHRVSQAAPQGPPCCSWRNACSRIRPWR